MSGNYRENLTTKSWTRGDYSISTNSTLIPVQRVIELFDSEVFHWATPIPLEETRIMLQNSLSFGLYHHSDMEKSDHNGRTFIGLARCVTDFVTFAYMTDVWVDPRYQGKGLGSWMIQCVDEVLDSMPYLRKSLLFTSDWKRSVPFYKKLMGMELDITQEGTGLAIMSKTGRGHPSHRKSAQ